MPHPLSLLYLIIKSAGNFRSKNEIFFLFWTSKVFNLKSWLPEPFLSGAGSYPTAKHAIFWYLPNLYQCFGSASIIMRIRIFVPPILHLDPDADSDPVEWA